MIRSTVTDLTTVELEYYQFIINLDKCSGSFNSGDNISTKICFPSKIKDVNIKVFNMVTNRNDAKILVKHISCE